MNIASTQKLNFMFTKSLIKEKIADLEAVEKDRRSEHQAIMLTTLKRDLIMLDNVKTDVMWNYYTGKTVDEAELEANESSFYIMNNKLMDQMIKEHSKYSQLVEFLRAIAEDKNEKSYGGNQ